VYAAGREALLANPAASEALQAVVKGAMAEDARMHASAALTALSDYHPHVLPDGSRDAQKPVMLSYQWDSQATVTRYTETSQQGPDLSRLFDVV
jgi:hypothetical protein